MGHWYEKKIRIWDSEWQDELAYLVSYMENIIQNSYQKYAKWVKTNFKKSEPITVLSFLPQNIEWFFIIELKENLKP